VHPRWPAQPRRPADSRFERDRKSRMTSAISDNAFQFVTSFMAFKELSAKRAIIRRLRPARLASVAGYGAHCIADAVDHNPRSGDAGRVIDGMGLRLRLHAFRHVTLRFGDDHSIVFGNKKPARNVPPKRAPDGNRDACKRYRPLHGSEHCLFVRGRVCAKAVAKAPSGSQIKPSASGASLGAWDGAPGDRTRRQPSRPHRERER
jgi:hypothetical protein